MGVLRFLPNLIIKTGTDRTSRALWGHESIRSLMKADRITFYGNARIGIVSKYFLVVCPAVVTELKLLKRFRLNGGHEYQERIPVSANIIEHKTLAYEQVK